MSILIRLLAVGFLILLTASAAEPEGTRLDFSQPRPKLTVRIYDYAGLAPRTLELARRQTAAIFGRAGVRWDWQQCRTSDDSPPSDPGCKQRVGPHLIQLRLHPRNMTREIAGGLAEYGYAAPVRNGYGIIAGVYVDRAELTAREVGLDLHVVLGYLMAHEIGHLLLGVESHSREGVMRAKWTDREMHLARIGALEFTERQAERMQFQAAARSSPAAPPTTVLARGQ